MEKQSDTLLRAEIRQGSCEPVTSSPVYALEDLKRGKSETIVNASVQELREGGQGYAILIHRLNEPNEFTGLCGDLAAAEEN